MPDAAARLKEAAGFITAGRFPDARRLVQTVLQETPDDIQAKYLLGLVALHEGFHAEAEQVLALVANLRPDSAAVLTNYGHALSRLSRYEQALAAYDRALAVKPGLIDAVAGKCNALCALARWPEAEDAYRQATVLSPQAPEIWNNCGAVLSLRGKRLDAIAMFDRALALRPTFVEALMNRGQERLHLRQFSQARDDFLRVQELDPSQARVEVPLLLADLWLCDWQRYDTLMARIDPARIDDAVCTPLDTLLLLQPPDQHAFAIKYAARKFPVQRKKLKPHAHERIRIGYVSGDFKDHPVGYLIAGLLEAHDRARFEVAAFSIGEPTDDETHRRLRASVDRYEEVRDRDDLQIAELMRAREIDIAVDLSGYTSDVRLGIFAHGTAPLQVEFLGYPGTTGASFMDYIIADRHVIPESEQAFYTERVVYLPDTCLPSDDKRAIAPQKPSRAELGLPESAFVFACFNTAYKITPPVFDIWMRLLKAVEGSILWLRGSWPEAEDNLRRSARARGVDPVRLVFTSPVTIAQHLARLQQADLVLDTLPYNGHTTTSDALWAGVPVLTCTGTTFAGRVATSLLHAHGVPELITPSLDAYESLATALARDPKRLADLRQRVAAARTTAASFDTQRFTRHLEAAFAAMHAAK